jgi:hypothetical protein
MINEDAYERDFRDHRKVKPKQVYLRWGLWWTLLFVLLLPPAPFWLIPLGCKNGLHYVFTINLWGAIVMLYVAYACIRTWRGIETAAAVDGCWKKRYPVSDRAKKLRHIVLMRGYKEPLDLMFATIDSLVAQSVAGQLIVVIGLEVGSPLDYDAAFYTRYKDAFSDFLVTRHPRGWVAEEKPGACSNANYAFRQIAQKLSGEPDFDPKALLVTSMDTDTIFPVDYMEYVGLQYLTHPTPHGVIWQAPLFYNLQLDDRPWFVRCTAILRTAFMSAFLIGQDLNPMSVFTFSLDLLIKADFINPRHTMDDVMHVLTCMKALQKGVPVIEVPLVVISGPTSGASLSEEWYEWARQARRWCIGTLDVYHYFQSKQCRGSFEFWAGVKYNILFTHYYGFVLCSLLLTGLFGACAAAYWSSVSPTNPGYCGAENGYSSRTVNATNLGCLAANYLSFAVMFMLDRKVVAFAGIEEDMPLWRNILHWLLTWPTLLMYNIVQVFASIEGSLRGESGATHNASNKDGLSVVIQTDSAHIRVDGGGDQYQLMTEVDPGARRV